MKKHFISTLLAFFVFSIAMQAQTKLEASSFSQVASGQTVLLGTYFWDAETDSFPSYGSAEILKGDIWWQQHNETEQSLVPRNGALIAEVRDKDFSELTIEDLKTLPYTRTPVSNENLVPGAVIAIRTAEGSFVKLRVVGYRALQDFSFKETLFLRENWKTLALSKKNTEKYHLEVEWALYTQRTSKTKRTEF